MAVNHHVAGSNPARGATSLSLINADQEASTLSTNHLHSNGFTSRCCRAGNSSAGSADGLRSPGRLWCSLAVGMCGYHFLERLPWIDALLNASMILGGMGPVDPLKTSAGKLFASFYALYSGLAIISVAGLLLAPVVHRLLHKFHVDNG